MVGGGDGDLAQFGRDLAALAKGAFIVALDAFKGQACEFGFQCGRIKLARLGEFGPRLGRVADAEATYRLVLERDPLFTPAMVELAELAGEAGRPEEAEQWIDAARACDPFSWKLAEYLTVRQTRATSASAEPAGP